jgi:hypothetical protein
MNVNQGREMCKRLSGMLPWRQCNVIKISRKHSRVRIIEVAQVAHCFRVPDVFFHLDLKERLRASAARQIGKTAMREHAHRQGLSSTVLLFA